MKHAKLCHCLVGLASIASLGAALSAPLPARALDLPYSTVFSGPNGSPWPAPWFDGGFHVTVWDLQQNRGRLNGDATRVARMILSGYAELDVEAEVTFEFEDVHNQGIGFYVRQNGGTLQEYQPHGQGYAMFLKGNWAWPEDLGLWWEVNGVETQFAWGNNPIAGGLQNDTRYRLRFRVTQSDPATTLIQAKVWPEALAEPGPWTIEAFDTRPELQGTLGSFAIDIYNFAGAQPIYIDELSIVRVLEPSSAQDPDDSPNSHGPQLSLPSPHPITSSTELRFALPSPATVTLRVFDTSGRQVAAPFSEFLDAGAHRLAWTPMDRRAQSLAPDVSFLQLQSDGAEVSRRIVVAR